MSRTTELDDQKSPQTAHENRLAAQEAQTRAEKRARDRLRAANIYDPMETPGMDPIVQYEQSQEYGKKLSTLILRYMRQPMKKEE